MAYAPTAISEAFTSLRSVFPGLTPAGIVGDDLHTWGYHRARSEVSSTDYSVQLPLDRQGPDDAASALDVTGDSGQLRLITARADAAMRRRDPRVRALREFFGPSADGSTVIGFDAPSHSFASSDDSHLWHAHFSFYRGYCTDRAALLDFAAALTDPDQDTDPGPHEPEDDVSITIRQLNGASYGFGIDFYRKYSDEEAAIELRNGARNGGPMNQREHDVLRSLHAPKPVVVNVTDGDDADIDAIMAEIRKLPTLTVDQIKARL